jgi:thiamine pyrophosphokinase
VIALVLAGGPLRADARLRGLASRAAFVVAADGGLRHAADLDVRPDLLVGDLDSVQDDDVRRWPDLAVERHSPDKDALDLELAIDAALREGATRVWVMGAFGGRFDQTLATALIAARWAEEGLDIALLDGIHDAYPLPSGRRFDEPLPEGTVFSLLAISDRARVDIAGAAYTLRDAELPRGLGRGLSNAARGGPVVTVREGLVLLIVEWDG